MKSSTYEIILHQRVRKFLRFHSELESRFLEKVNFLAKGAFEKADCRPLKGEIDRYRLRIGGYRFFYELKNHQLIIYFYDADTRGDAYK